MTSPDTPRAMLALADKCAAYIKRNEGCDPEWSLIYECEALLRAAAQPAPGGGADWQDIATAPKDGREVILKVKYRAGIPGKCLVGHYMPVGHCIEGHPPIGEGWYFWNGCMFDEASKPIAWMSLPSSDTPSQPIAPPTVGATSGEVVAWRNFMALLIVKDDGGPVVVIREQTIPTRIYATALNAAVPSPSPEPAMVREALQRIRDFPHSCSPCEQAMAQIARDALALLSQSGSGDGWIEALRSIAARVPKKRQPGERIVCPVCHYKSVEPHDKPRHAPNCAGEVARRALVTPSPGAGEVERAVDAERQRCSAIISAARFDEVDRDWRALASMIDGGLTVAQLTNHRSPDNG